MVAYGTGNYGEGVYGAGREEDELIVEVMEALADQIRSTLGQNGTADPLIEHLQVEPLQVWNPSPPAIDIYPADEFQTQLGMGAGNKVLHFTVRARVNTPDVDGSQALLLSMMDPIKPTSLEQAITADRTLGGVVEHCDVEEGPSGYGEYSYPGGAAMLGCVWRVMVMPVIP